MSKNFEYFEFLSIFDISTEVTKHCTLSTFPSSMKKKTHKQINLMGFEPMTIVLLWSRDVLPLFNSIELKNTFPYSHKRITTVTYYSKKQPDRHENKTTRQTDKQTTDEHKSSQRVRNTTRPLSKCRGLEMKS